MSSLHSVCVCLSLWLTATSVVHSESVTPYNVGDLVPVSINTVGPYRNPNEKYPFFSKVPFCKPEASKGAHAVDANAGSVFMGDRAVMSDYKLPFNKNMGEPQVVCEQTLDQNQIKKLIGMIRENYMFEFFVDHNLLITGFLGKEEEELVPLEDADGDGDARYDYALFLHWNFHCEYNGNYVISCRITTDLDKQRRLEFGEDLSVTFTYSVSWSAVDISPQDRLLYHVRRLVQSQPLEVHWLSTLNSFILVLLVTAFVALVFGTILRNDCRRYLEEDSGESDLQDPGWKQLQRDVFRPPPRPLLFSAVIGVGTQLLVLMMSLLVLALVGWFYPGNRGSIISALLVAYAATAGVAGHVAAKLYVGTFGGQKWATLALLTASLLPGPLAVVFSVVNGIAWHRKSSIALPFSTIVMILFLWLAVTVPLTVFAARRVWQSQGGQSGRAAEAKNVSMVPREIPKLAWYRHWAVQVALSGILPFTAIYIELHFLFMAVFGHQVYTLFGILSLAVVMLLIVTCAVTIGLTYFQLQSEDWRWWWSALLTAGSTGVYVAVYSVFYYNYRSYMSGVLQAAVFFGYVSVVSYSFVLMLGATGWWATYMFLGKIYGAIKSE